MADPGHVQTQTLRHECTNYDALRQRAEVQALPELELNLTVVIIKYQCTAKVLQRRAGLLRDQVADAEASYRDLDDERSRLRRVILLLQRKLFGKDQKIEQLESKVTALKTENEALKADSEKSKAYAELLEEFQKLQEAYEKVAQRRRELAKNNQSLGGRVAHTKRFRRERDEAREILAEQKDQIAELMKYNQDLKAKNEWLTQQLNRSQKI
ncbi:MAG: hypothetical protein WBD47_15245 [Phormidesmis sp.]